MNVTARRTCPTPTLRSRSRNRKPTPSKYEREPSDMAVEMLTRILRALWVRHTLSIREQQVLFHYLYGRSPALTGERLGLRETTVHKHLHRVFARTRTSSRRELIDLGLEIARAQGISGSPVVCEEAPTLLRAA